METIIQLDHSLFHFINGTLSNSLFDVIMPFITNENNVAIPLIIIWLYLFLYGGKRGKIAATLILISVIITDVFAAQVIKPYFARLRPSRAMLDNINLLVPRGGKYGFVSNHAANTMAAALIIAYFYKNWGYFALSVSILVGFSRIYVGVHYPFDVVGGWIFGFLVSSIIITLWVLLKVRETKRGKTWIKYT